MWLLPERTCQAGLHYSEGMSAQSTKGSQITARRFLQGQSLNHMGNSSSTLFLSNDNRSSSLMSFLLFVVLSDDFCWKLESPQLSLTNFIILVKVCLQKSKPFGSGDSNSFISNSAIISKFTRQLSMEKMYQLN